MERTWTLSVVKFRVFGHYQFLRFNRNHRMERTWTQFLKNIRTNKSMVQTNYANQETNIIDICSIFYFIKQRIQYTNDFCDYKILYAKPSFDLWQHLSLLQSAQVHTNNYIQSRRVWLQFVVQTCNLIFRCESVQTRN